MEFLVIFDVRELSVVQHIIILICIMYVNIWIICFIEHLYL